MTTSRGERDPQWCGRRASRGRERRAGERLGDGDLVGVLRTGDPVLISLELETTLPFAGDDMASMRSHEEALIPLVSRGGDGECHRRYDDLYDPKHDLDIKEVLEGLPREVVDAQHQRLKRATDLSMKCQYLSDFQVVFLRALATKMLEGRLWMYRSIDQLLDLKPNHPKTLDSRAVIVH
ncbi:hypothetical protein GUJ93_ZPchr0012g19388 [Zizania palustris]|uniref:Uncharacterized protein n=1 Tax=Zizania palustris TaxID=103762 RepID=A0A8J6BSU3_ZIZPA|nr:hypothetical protein GUJ93_ZPchr0012g19388 [Zizania palustris]